MRKLWALTILAGCGEGSGGSVASGPNPFDESVLATYEITLPAADWNAVVANPFDNTWRRCTVRWQQETYTDVALRPSGRRSRIPGNPKPSIRLKFDEFVENREFHNFSNIKLDSLVHDASMMRARLEYPLYEARGIPAPRYVHARLFVNGAYQGLYASRSGSRESSCANGSDSP